MIRFFASTSAGGLPGSPARMKSSVGLVTDGSLNSPSSPCASGYADSTIARSARARSRARWSCASRAGFPVGKRKTGSHEPGPGGDHCREFRPPRTAREVVQGRARRVRVDSRVRSAVAFSPSACVLSNSRSQTLPAADARCRSAADARVDNGRASVVDPLQPYGYVHTLFW